MIYSGAFSAALRRPLVALWWYGYALGPFGRRLRILAWDLALAMTATPDFWLSAVDPSGGTDGKGRGQGSGAVRAGV